MRLIDADKLWKHKFKSASERMDLTVRYMKGWNDAICSIVENAPTVDAIPVEWIKKYEKHDDLAASIYRMLEAWGVDMSDD